VWQRSFSNPAGDEDSGAASPQLQLFGVGAHLSELQSDLKEQPEAQEMSDALLSDFDDLTAAVRQRDPVLVKSIAARLAASLEGAAQRFPELTAKCADLGKTVERLADSSSDGTTSADWDEELPF
jgi:hypothetical protein